MIDDHDVREMLQRRADSVPATPVDTPTAVRRARRRLALNGAVATAAAAAIAVATFAGIDAIRSAPIPADDPLEELGIFAPVAGRIVYENGGNDRGYATGIWAVDPLGPTDSAEGLSVAEDVASTLERLDLEGAEPLGWSSDGTELLLMRSVGDSLLPEQYLSILHADGSETRLNEDPMGISGATISPDGTRVVFAGQYQLSGLYVIDAEGGRPVPLPIPQATEDGASDPTFSPDGTQIAYLNGNGETGVWVANSDGTDGRKILSQEYGRFGPGVTGLQWSPAGDRLALGLGDHKGGGRPIIFTFSPDGSDFTPLIDGGISPFWSPDGSQIAFTIPCDEQPDGWCPEGSIRRSEFDPQPGDGPAGLAIADADGSNVREFGFAASGPWHPGVPVEEPAPTPTPTPVETLDDTLRRVDGEVLSFTGAPGVPGDLVAVNPETGGERPLITDIDSIYSASWSADGRWVAYETEGAAGDRDLWVAGESQDPRRVATGGDPGSFVELGLYWMWSPTGAELATIGRSSLRTVDFTTGRTTDLGKVVADLLETNSGPKWAWSPDGTRLVFAAPEGAPEGSLDTVEVPSGERSLLARLPDEDWELTERVLWSPDGAHIAVLIRKASNEAGRLYVMDADATNIRVVADDYDPLGVAWSPDGTRLVFGEGSEAEGDVRIRVATIGAASTEIGSASFSGCTYNYECTLAWSPDGSQIAFRKARSGEVTSFDDAGAGETEPIDELTYLNWEGGTYPYRA
jgi:Tol biopolymer transport system component